MPITIHNNEIAHVMLFELDGHKAELTLSDEQGRFKVHFLGVMPPDVGRQLWERVIQEAEWRGVAEVYLTSHTRDQLFGPGSMPSVDGEPIAAALQEERTIFKVKVHIARKSLG